MAAITLRPFDPSDFETLYAIDQKCYPRGIAYSRRELRWYLKSAGADCLVAVITADTNSTAPSDRVATGEADGRSVHNVQLAGFLIAIAAGSEAHLITIDVIESQRRSGVGTALLGGMEARLVARGVRRVTLETATSNEAAVAFWRRHGYRTVGTIRGYYLGRLDAYEMHKNLPASSD